MQVFIARIKRNLRIGALLPQIQEYCLTEDWVRKFPGINCTALNTQHHLFLDREGTLRAHEKEGVGCGTAKKYIMNLALTINS